MLSCKDNQELCQVLSIGLEEKLPSENDLFRLLKVVYFENLHLNSKLLDIQNISRFENGGNFRDAFNALTDIYDLTTDYKDYENGV